MNRHEADPRSWLGSHWEQIESTDRLMDAPDHVSIAEGTKAVGLEGSSQQSLDYYLAIPKSLESAMHDTSDGGKPRSSLPVIIRFGQWSEHARRQFDADRSIAVAAATNNVVIAVDTPGQSPVPAGAGNLTAEQASSLKQKKSDDPRVGQLDPIARSQWSVIEQVLADSGLDISDTEITLAGSSQGASLAVSALATAPESAKIGTVILWNSPSFTYRTERSPAGLMRDFMQTGAGDATYKAQNPEWVSEDPITRLIPQVGKRAAGHLLAVKAISHAEDHERLPSYLLTEEGRRHSDVLWRIIHGEQDPISRVEHNERAAKMLVGVTPEVSRAQLAQEYHAIVNCIPAVGYLIKKALQ